MNKTTTANIGGIAFNIDLDAYDELQRYLNAIGKYFGDSESRKEIMSDIESRIAELFKERMSNDNQVITKDVVKEIIGIMGEPEQYADEENHTESRTYTNTSNRKKIYRDPDNKAVGGVCSGIGYYFGINPMWIRLFFILAFLGWGTGILLYIILWIIIPEASTTAEKLEMKGEPINVDNIGKTIDEELKKVKETIDDIADRTSKMDTKGTVDEMTKSLEKFFQFFLNIATKFFQTIGKFLMMLLTFLSKIFGIAFVISGTILLILLIASIFNSSSILSITSEGFHYYSLQQLFNYVSADPNHWLLLTTSAALFVGIPILALIYGGIRLIMPSGTPIGFKGVGISFFALWVVGIVTSVILAFQIGMEFKNVARVEEPTEIVDYQGKLLVVNLDTSMFEDELDDTFDDKYTFNYIHNGDPSVMFRFGRLLFQPEEDGNFVGLPKLNIIKSGSDKIKIKINKRARGKTIKQAENRARSIDYDYVLNDSMLTLNPAFLIADQEMLFRNQSVRIDLMIPENTVVDFSSSSERLLYNYSNISEEWYDKRSWGWSFGGNRWMMLDDGITCINCEESDLLELDSTQQAIVRNLPPE